MPLETATYVSSLVVTNPDGSDQKNTADDHIRLIKACLRRTLPLLDGAVSLSHTQLMLLGDVSQSVQLQLNNLRDGSATANNAINSRFANSASFATHANNLAGAAAAQYVRKDVTPTIGVQVLLTAAEPMRFLGSNQFFSWYNSAMTQRFGFIQHVDGNIFIANETSGYVDISAINIRVSGFGVWHSGNDGPGSGLDADSVDGGYHVSEAAAGSTLVGRTGAGHVYATYFNSSSSDSENPNVVNIIVTNGDGFFRKATPAYLGTQMQARNITGKSGTAKTLSSSTPSGGIDGDMWYRT